MVDVPFLYCVWGLAVVSISLLYPYPGWLVGKAGSEAVIIFRFQLKLEIDLEIYAFFRNKPPSFHMQRSRSPLVTVLLLFICRLQQANL